MGLANVKVELDNGVCTLGVKLHLRPDRQQRRFLLPQRAGWRLYTLVQTDLADYFSTADSDPPNDNQINVIISGDTSSSGHIFLDSANTGSCAAPDPVTGFVASTSPFNGETGVSMGITTLTVTFNQPMKTSGGGNVLDKGQYDNNIDNITLGDHVDILNVSYDPVTYTATLTIDTSDPEWQPGSQFRLRIKKGIKNACDDDAGLADDIDILFTTEYAISGQVQNAGDDNKGIYGVSVGLLAGSCNGISNTTTDINGEFNFYGCLPGHVHARGNRPGRIQFC